MSQLCIFAFSLRHDDADKRLDTVITVAPYGGSGTGEQTR